MDPNLYKLTVVRHQERLQTAAEARRFSKVSTARPGRWDQIWTHLKGYLVLLGKKRLTLQKVIK